MSTLVCSGTSRVVSSAYIYIYYVIVHKVHTKKEKVHKKGKKHLTTNMCIDHQLIP